MIKFSTDAKKMLSSDKPLVLCAPLSFYQKGWHQKVLDKKTAQLFDALIKKAKSSGKNMQWTRYAKNDRAVTLVALRDKISRHNSPVRKNEIYESLNSAVKESGTQVICGVEKEEHNSGTIAAVARTLKVYSKKKGAKAKSINLLVTSKSGTPYKLSAREKANANAVAWTCELIDTPPAEMTPKHMAQSIKKRFKDKTGIKIQEFVGDKLLSMGMGGAHAVGRTAPEAPRVVVLECGSSKAKDTVVLGGKGVTYDTGGLSLKIQGSMVGMKCDMGGAAAVLGAFEVLAAAKLPVKVVAIVGLVENAIGPDAYRPDDILSMHSGKTVEINNTDAEGRLVLADCMSYAIRKYKPSLAVNAATLTGAQLVATGNAHASVIANTDKGESVALKASKTSGDLVCSLPFAPEFLQKEFSSEVADMCNSVKNRMNAQTSCAAQFIYSHIEDCKVDWVHIDLAGPAFIGSRGTGFGVGLMVEMVDKYFS